MSEALQAASVASAAAIPISAFFKAGASFTPSPIIPHKGVSSRHSYLQPVLYQSIILTGGSTLFHQLKERLERELRPLVPDHFDVNITTQEDPILDVWRGGSLLASSPDFESMCVTKADYEELGSARCRRRFFH